MARVEVQTPEGVYFAVKAATGPVRSCVFEAIAILMCAQNGTLSESASTSLQGLIRTLDEAKDMLAKGTAAHFSTIGRSVPAELQTKMGKALRSVQTAIDRLSASMTASENGSDVQENCNSILDFTQNTLRPDIDGFLNGLTQHFEEETKRTAADDRDLIKSAMQEIDNISMSINLISLNASVEAARAGEAGRGFAVIAAEIQSLSSDSKKAVDSIRQRLT